MKTLTGQGIEEICQMFADSISHGLFQHDGEPKTIPIFRTVVDGDFIRIYIYFDDEFEGSISNVELISKKGNVVARAERELIKPEEKGLYVAFKYKFVEVEVENVETVY